MIDSVVLAIEKVIRLIAYVVATLFWAIFGFFVWSQILLFALMVFTAHIAFAPFSTTSRDVNPLARSNLNAAIRFWPEGFKTIAVAVWGPPEFGVHPRGESFLVQFFSFLKHCAASLALWTIWLFLLHVVGIWRHSTFEPLEFWKPESKTVATIRRFESLANRACQCGRSDCTGKLIGELRLLISASAELHPTKSQQLRIEKASNRALQCLEEVVGGNRQ